MYPETSNNRKLLLSQMKGQGKTVCLKHQVRAAPQIGGGWGSLSGAVLLRAAAKIMTRDTEAGSGKETACLISACVCLLPNLTKASKKENLGDTCKRLSLQGHNRGGESRQGEANKTEPQEHSLTRLGENTMSSHSPLGGAIKCQLFALFPSGFNISIFVFLVTLCSLGGGEGTFLSALPSSVIFYMSTLYQSQQANAATCEEKKQEQEQE